jgi:hypothetical protein
VEESERVKGSGYYEGKRDGGQSGPDNKHFGPIQSPKPAATVVAAQWPQTTQH